MLKIDRSTNLLQVYLSRDQIPYSVLSSIYLFKRISSKQKLNQLLIYLFNIYCNSSRVYLYKFFLIQFFFLVIYQRHFLCFWLQVLLKRYFPLLIFSKISQFWVCIQAMYLVCLPLNNIYIYTFVCRCLHETSSCLLYSF